MSKYKKWYKIPGSKWLMFIEDEATGYGICDDGEWEKFGSGSPWHQDVYLHPAMDGEVMERLAKFAAKKYNIDTRFIGVDLGVNRVVYVATQQILLDNGVWAESLEDEEKDDMSRYKKWYKEPESDWLMFIEDKTAGYGITVRGDWCKVDVDHKSDWGPESFVHPATDDEVRSRLAGFAAKKYNVDIKNIGVDVSQGTVACYETNQWLLGNGVWAESLEVKEEPIEEDNAINPDHYKQYDKEVIDMMIAIWGEEETAIFCKLNAFKYRMRLGHKDNIPQELQKEKWYLDKKKELNK